MRAGFLDAPRRPTPRPPSVEAKPEVLPVPDSDVKKRTPEATTRAFIDKACSSQWRHGHEIVFPTNSTTDDENVSHNLLLLLCGRGEVSPKAFATFATAIDLPNTTCVSLLGCCALPFGLQGREWFENFDVTTGGELPVDENDCRRVDSLRKTVDDVLALIDALSGDSTTTNRVNTHCPYTAVPKSRIHVFGFSDGGTVALAVALRRFGKQRLGGVAVVAAGLLRETLTKNRTSKESGVNETQFQPNCGAPTPVTMVCGKHDSVVPMQLVLETQKLLLHVNPGCVADVFVDERRKSHAMITSPEATEHLMRFWGLTLGVPNMKAQALGEDVVEIPGGMGSAL